MEWVKVPGYEHIEITRCGRVRSAAYTVVRKSRWGTESEYNFAAREMTVCTSSHGYRRVVVMRKGRRGPIYLHQLMARAFVPGHVPGYHVNHINGIKADNRPENLEWVPGSENVKHAWRTGLVNLRGANSKTAKLSPARVQAIRRLLALGANNNTIALVAGLSPATIWKVANGLSWQSVNGLGVEDAAA